MIFTIRVFVCLAAVFVASVTHAATLRVCASGCEFTSVQAAIDAAVPGDTILLRAGETFIGHVVLKTKPWSTDWITIRSDAPDAQLPADGVRLVPSGKPRANTSRSLLPRLLGAGGALKTTPVVQTEPGAHHYLLKFIEIDGSANLGNETLIYTGDDSAAQTATDIVFDRIYAHGHPEKGQKRGISLNSVRTDILNSYFSEFMAVAADSQAIAGYNGAGPFRIINNYLEGAGENILFGGADPSVYDLVPTGIEIRRNTITKPLAWRNAILPAPSGLQGWDGGGGSLASGTHYFSVIALMDTGPSVAHSVASVQAAVSVGGSRSVSLTWTAVPGANRYRIYRGTSSGGQSRYLETPSSSTSFSYTGSGEHSGAPPTTGTRWSVKNLIELKNAQQVTVDGNIIEHIWPAGQFGFAIVLTPRNQSGGAPWVRVRDVAFTNNVIRHAAGVIQIVGYDDNGPSQQTQRITFRNNLLYDIAPPGSGDSMKGFLIGNGPASIVIDHNTIIHNAPSVVYAYGSQTIPGFVFTNNVTLHNDYGIMAESGQPGRYSIDKYFPSADVTYNVFLGGSPSLYPTPNTFPTLAEWNQAFVNTSVGDYRLPPGSAFYSAGAGGSVPGANIGLLELAMAAPASGPTPEPEPPPVPAPVNTAPVARPGGPYLAATGAPFIADASGSSDAEGPIAAYLWRWADDIVMHAADVPPGDVAGTAWVRTERPDAARGIALHNPDRGAAKLSSPLASPTSYVDVYFYAAAGVPYRFWMRTLAQNDAWTNDSLFVQFSSRVDAAGNPIDRIGTTQAAAIVLEEGGGAGVAGWGWNDEAYGTLAAPMYFGTSGLQRLRVQQREDGIMWDQIVVSANTYRAASPGLTRHDQTVVSPALGTSASPVSSHTYVVPGQYPLVLSVADPTGLAGSAQTSVTVTTGGAPSATTANHGGPYAGSANQSVTFDGSASAAGAGAQYLWMFGDEIVLDSSDLHVTGSRWKHVADASAAAGVAVENPELHQPKLTTPLASPASYIEATFQAAAGVPYRFWIRMRAADDSWANDSIFVQFSGRVDPAGAAVDRIGSSSAMGVVLEDGGGVGVLGWGWTDGGYGTLGGPVYFQANGEQRIRIQQREDGLRIDQIVISAGAFYHASPGRTKQDTTLVPVFPAASRGVVVSRAFRSPGLFPVRLFVVDGATTATAATTVTIR